MLFFEPHFVLLFLPVFIFSIYLSEKIGCGSKIVISIFSVLFYISFSLQYFIVFFTTIVFIYTYQITKKHRYFIFFYISTLLLLLCFYKYSNFFFEILGGQGLIRNSLALPLGISFFIFQEITFLVWIGGKDTHKVKFIDLFNYIAYFPQLIAGPIATPKDLLLPLQKYKPQINVESMSCGLLLFSIGVFKKVIIADSLSDAVSIGFGGGDPGGTRATLAILCFTMQLYFDFSGYMDMARGISKMIGIELPINFNKPYRALNISDFWQRWHITLTRLIMNFIYTPLMMKFMNFINHRNFSPGSIPYLNLLVIILTMSLAGLWHGANSTFIIFGALHGVALALDKLLDRGWIATSILRYLLMWSTIFLGFAFFRADNIDIALLLLNSSIFGQYIVLPETPLHLSYLLIALFMVVLPRDSVENNILKFKPIFRTLMATIIYIVAIPWMDTSSPFLYWQF